MRPDDFGIATGAALVYTTLAAVPLLVPVLLKGRRVLFEVVSYPSPLDVGRASMAEIDSAGGHDAFFGSGGRQHPPQRPRPKSQ